MNNAEPAEAGGAQSRGAYYHPPRGPRPKGFYLEDSIYE